MKNVATRFYRAAAIFALIGMSGAFKCPQAMTIHCHQHTGT